MTEHFWMRRAEFLDGRAKKPPYTARWVIDLYRARVAFKVREAAKRSACRRLDAAMGRWAA